MAHTVYTVSVCYFTQNDRYPNHEQILQLETAVLKCLQSLQNNNTCTTGVLHNKIPFYSKLYT